MTSFRTSFLFILSVLFTQAIPAQQLGAPGEQRGKGVVVLKAAQIIDGTGAAAIRNGVIVVTDDKITAVVSADRVTVPAGARVIDMGDATLMPGFFFFFKQKTAYEID